MGSHTQLSDTEGSEDSEGSATGFGRKSSDVPGCCGCSPNGAKRCFGQNYFHVARCGMCKPGRHHGAGGAKALKKVSGSHGRAAKAEWIATLNEARLATRAPPVDEYDPCTLQFRKLPLQFTAGAEVELRRMPITLHDWFPEGESLDLSLDKNDWELV